MSRENGRIFNKFPGYVLRDRGLLAKYRDCTKFTFCIHTSINLFFFHTRQLAGRSFLFFFPPCFFERQQIHIIFRIWLFPINSRIFSRRNFFFFFLSTREYPSVSPEKVAGPIQNFTLANFTLAYHRLPRDHPSSYRSRR